MGKELLSEESKSYVPRGCTDPFDQNYSQIRRIYNLDLDLGRRVDWIYKLELIDELGWENRKLYLDVVENLAEAGKVEEGQVITSSRLAMLLIPKYANRIPSALENPVFQYFVNKGRLPAWSFGGREMLKDLKRGERRKSYDNELQLVRELGREDSRYPDIIIGLGCGGGEKETERASCLLNAGRDVALVLVDYSQEAIDESKEHANRVFSNILGQFPKDKKPQGSVFCIRDIFEHLPDNQQFQDILGKYPNKIFTLYGSTAGNSHPSKSAKELSDLMKPGDYAEIGIHLHDGNDNAVLQLYGNNGAKAVTSRGLRSLGFESEEIESMIYEVRIEKEKYPQHPDLGITSIVQTSFIATKPMLVGLAFLRTNERLISIERYLYEDEQFRQVFTQGGFVIFNKRQIENDAIYQMVKQ